MYGIALWELKPVFQIVMGKEFIPEVRRSILAIIYTDLFITSVRKKKTGEKRSDCRRRLIGQYRSWTYSMTFKKERPLRSLKARPINRSCHTGSRASLQAVHRNNLYPIVYNNFLFYRVGKWMQEKFFFWTFEKSRKR